MILFGQREDKESKQIRDDYRRVFSSRDGQRVLMYMLKDLGWFDQIKDERGMALQNYARHLLEQMGMLHEYSAGELVKKLFELPVYRPAEQKRNKKENQ